MITINSSNIRLPIRTKLRTFHAKADLHLHPALSAPRDWQFDRLWLID